MVRVLIGSIGAVVTVAVVIALVPSVDFKEHSHQTHLRVGATVGNLIAA